MVLVYVEDRYIWFVLQFFLTGAFWNVVRVHVEYGSGSFDRKIDQVRLGY